MAVWLKQSAIRTLALQSTGVYWIAVYDILEEAGFEVYLVNANQTKNLPGRNGDVQGRQWLMKLHAYGLLRNSRSASRGFLERAETESEFRTPAKTLDQINVSN